MTYTGSPLSGLYWMHDDIEIQSSRDFEITNLPERSCLRIPEVFAEDSGKYTVQISNLSGTVECSCRLTVIGLFLYAKKFEIIVK